MNLFQLILKQMRQRALGTWLTLLSVVLGVALAAAVLLISRESKNLFGQTDFGFDIIVGPPKGSPQQLTLNTVYHLGMATDSLSYGVYDDLARRRQVPGKPFYARSVKVAVPIMVGDSYNGRRIVGTLPQMFGFDDEGKPLAGYDDKGNRLPSFAHPDTDDEALKPGETKAAATIEYRRGKKYTLAEGRSFHGRRFEAVIGSDVAAKENLKIGSKFKITHGMPAGSKEPDVHDLQWTVVGILNPTHTANDRVLFVPIVSLLAIGDHTDGLIDQAFIRANIKPDAVPKAQLPAVLKQLGFDPNNKSIRRRFKLDPPATQPEQKHDHDHDHDNDHEHADHDDHDHEGHDHAHDEAFHLDAEGNIVPDLPKDEWEISAILIKTRGGITTGELLYNLRVGRDDATGVNPADVMREFFNTFFKNTTLLLVVLAGLVSIVAAMSILVSIYNSISARQKEIAILRALGATRMRILAIICLEAGLIGLVGGFVGIIVGHLLAGAGSAVFQQWIGESIDWVTPSPYEGIYLAGVTIIAVLAGLVPALKAYTTPVAANLAGE